MGHVCPGVSNTNSDLRGQVSSQSQGIRRQNRAAERSTNSAHKEDFTFIKVIGLGSYGKVFLVQHKLDGNYYAMKVIKKELVYRTCSDEGIKAERDILTMFDHPFIMKLEYAFQDANNLYMVMEFVNGGELFYQLHMYNRTGFEQNRAKFYAAQIVLALDHMHKEGVVYRDLKPENILIDSEGYLRITDFGLSKISKQIEKKDSSNNLLTMEDRTTTFCGTLEYMAPEMMQNKSYSHSVDWFSFGILLFEMLCGKNPFKNAMQESVPHDQVAMKIQEILTQEKELMAEHENTFSPEAYDLLEKLLRYDPEYRIGCRDLGVNEIMVHPFFRNIDWGLIERKGMQASFVPERKEDPTDVSNFASEFTKMSLEETPDTRFGDIMGDDAQFDNFTYVHKHELQQAMQNTDTSDHVRSRQSSKQSDFNYNRNDSIPRPPPQRH